MPTKDALLIIDGYGFVFRAYHVLPKLTSPNGGAVGALYGFTLMLLKLLNDFKPLHAVVVLDSDGPNFRHQIYEQYKANRPPVPPDLIDQLPLIRQAASSLNFPIIEKAGYEADDIIATLANKVAKSQENAIVVSSDKDLMQLINSHTKMYDPIKTKYISEDDVIAKFGVGPGKLREVMALIGDRSDNIPGVPGIGPKTAATLIQQFGSVKTLLNLVNHINRPLSKLAYAEKFEGDTERRTASSTENVREDSSTGSTYKLPAEVEFSNRSINDRQRQLIASNSESALISWQLVGLDDNVDINCDFSFLQYQPPNLKQISGFLTEYGFKSLTKRIETLFQISITNEALASKQIAIQEITSKAQLNDLMAEAQEVGIVGIYLLDQPGHIPTIILSIDNKCYNIKFVAEATHNMADLLFDNFFQNYLSQWFICDIIKLLQDRSIKKITYNLKSLLKLFGNDNIVAMEDIALMQYLISAGKEQQNPFAKPNNPDLEDIGRIVTGFGIDYQNLLLRLKNNHVVALYKDIDLPLCYVIDSMEKNGIKIDSEYLKQLSKEFGDEIIKLEQEIFDITGTKFNIASPKQLGEVLFEKMQLPYGKVTSKSKSYSTSAEILEKISEGGFAIGDLLLKWRHFTKLKNTYTDNLPSQVNSVTGRVHTTFLQTSTSTGRLSSQEPNLQNVPIRSKEGINIRRAFIAEQGHKLISADYSQIELRILSAMADIPSLKQAFINVEDIHNKTACNIFQIAPKDLTQEHRRKAKAINFGIIYGISAFGLAKQLNITPTQSQEYIKKYFAEYPEIAKYMEYIKDYVKQHGYVLNSFGRKCFIPLIHSQQHALRQFAERAAINAPIQGTSADIIKVAMLDLNREIRNLQLKTRLILQIHDELLFESPIDEIPIITPLIKTTMENATNFIVPLIVDIKVGDNWADTENYLV